MDTINSISNKFTELSELQGYCLKQAEALKQAKDIIQKLNKEIIHLKSLVPSKDVEVVEKSNEQIICEMEIDKLKATSFERSLTLEETKRLDLLVKNLLLAKGAYQDIKPDYRTIPKGLTSEKLLEIAAVTSSEEV